MFKIQHTIWNIISLKYKNMMKIDFTATASYA